MWEKKHNESSILHNITFTVHNPGKSAQKQYTDWNTYFFLQVIAVAHTIIKITSSKAATNISANCRFSSIGSMDTASIAGWKIIIKTQNIYKSMFPK